MHLSTPSWKGSGLCNLVVGHILAQTKFESVSVKKNVVSTTWGLQSPQCDIFLGQILERLHSILGKTLALESKGLRLGTPL